jgi:hypothetical protein
MKREIFVSGSQVPVGRGGISCRSNCGGWTAFIADDPAVYVCVVPYILWNHRARVTTEILSSQRESRHTCTLHFIFHEYIKSREIQSSLAFTIPTIHHNSAKKQECYEGGTIRNCVRTIPIHQGYDGCFAQFRNVSIAKDLCTEHLSPSMMNIHYGTQGRDENKNHSSSLLVWDIPGKGSSCALTVEDTMIHERCHDYAFSDNRGEDQREKVVPVRIIHIGEYCLPRMADVAMSCMTAPWRLARPTRSIQERPQLIEIDFGGNQVVECWQQETKVEIGYQGLPVIKSTYSLAKSRACYDDAARFFIALGRLGHAGVAEVVIKGLDLDESEGELLFGDCLARENCEDSRDDYSTSTFDSLTKPIPSSIVRKNDPTPVITFRDCSLEAAVIRMFQRLYPGSLRRHLAGG